MSMHERGYIWEKGRTHGILGSLVLVNQSLPKCSRRLCFWSEPGDVDNFFVFLESSDRHRHIIIRRHNLSNSVSVNARKFSVGSQTSWKSSLNRLCSNSAYFSNRVSKKSSSVVTE
jgi:hypothetical protein